jgi:hypothetical protein
VFAFNLVAQNLSLQAEMDGKVMFSERERPTSLASELKGEP